MKVEAHAAGAVLGVRAAAGSSRERVVGVHGAALKIAVSAPPEKGRANERLAAVLAAALGVPARSVELVSGHHARDKRFLLRGITVAELQQRIDALVD